MSLHITYTQMLKKRNIKVVLFKILILKSSLAFDVDLALFIGFGQRCTRTGPVYQSAAPYVK